MPFKLSVRIHVGVAFQQSAWACFFICDRMSVIGLTSGLVLVMELLNTAIESSLT